MSADSMSVDQGAVWPAVAATVMVGDQPADLSAATGATLRLYLAGDLVWERPASIDPDQVTYRGRVVYLWQPGDTDLPATYGGQIVVQFPDGPRIFPGPEEPLLTIVVSAPGPTRLALGTCEPWATADDVTDPAVQAVAEGLLDDCLQMASDVLYLWTGRRWPGSCTSVVRPVNCDCWGWGGSLADRARAWAPTWGGSLADYTRSVSSCRCPQPSRVRLGAYPVTGIVEVLVGADVVPADEYVVQDRRYLVGLASGASRRARVWPCCQRMDLPAGVPGTFQVTLWHGTPPPVGGRMAAALLAGQLALAFDPDAQGCKLPQRVVSATRQGITKVISDPSKLFSEGQTGLVPVDLWLASVVQSGKRRRGSVLVPGSQKPVHRQRG